MPVFLLGRLDDGVDAQDAGIELFGDALDHAALARGVGALEDEDDVAFALENLALEVEQVELQVLHLLAVVGFVVDLLGEVEFAEQAGHTIGKNVWPQPGGEKISREFWRHEDRHKERVV